MSYTHLMMDKMLVGIDLHFHSVEHGVLRLKDGRLHEIIKRIELIFNTAKYVIVCLRFVY